MKFPSPLKPGSTIGITGPSGGVASIFHPRLNLSINNLETHGYQILEGSCLRAEDKHVSAPKEDRAREFMEMYLNEEVDAIFPPWGGELLIEILPLLDFDAMASVRPKWVIGYSDISTLLFALTTKLDIATVHGTNLMDSIPQQCDSLSLGLLSALAMNQKEELRQQNSTSFQEGWVDFKENPEMPFSLTNRTIWKHLGNADHAVFSGRLIGGCLDTIACLTGTPYGDMPSFVKKHRVDGTILYLENCELRPPSVVRFLTNLKFAGWMDGLSGVLIGRSTGPDVSDPSKLNYLEALESVFEDIDVPVIYDVDIGHQPPQLTLLNGALAKVTFNGQGGSIDQLFC